MRERVNRRTGRREFPPPWRERRALWVIGILGALLLISGTAIWWWLRPPAPIERVTTLAVPDGLPRKTHHEPFGVSVDDDGNVYFSESRSGTIRRLDYDSYRSGGVAMEAEVIFEGLETPSAIALDEDGRLVVANTGAHTIVRIDLGTKQATVVAGRAGESGDSDGSAGGARFNAPVGVAIGRDGEIYVADTYNDSIRMIASDGTVSTIAGGVEQGFADGAGRDARFDTPCGIAVAENGELIVADTGNHRIRRVDPGTGKVATVAGTGEPAEIDGPNPAFDEPTAILINNDKSFYVADAAGSSIRLVSTDQGLMVTTLTGGEEGLADGPLAEAKLSRPAGMAFLPRGEILIAETGNGLLRAAVGLESKTGGRADRSSMILGLKEMKAMLEPRWPFDPPQSRRDIAGTLGEIRGELLPEHDAWFHNGLDIPGAYGETVLAIHSETVTRPLAVFGAGGTRERIRLPLFEYIHLRLGRDAQDKPLPGFPDGAITFRRDESGAVTGVRVRRGTRIRAGQPIGTLNRLNHAHLVAGLPGHEFNALAVLKLPGLIDTTPPTIESVKVEDSSGGRRVIVRAFDQVDGNPKYRRLGLYRLGYRLLRADGSPAPGYENPRYTIVFDRLPRDFKAVKIVYAEGSQSGYQGVTIFDYIVTNQVGGGNAKESFLEAEGPGEFRLQILAEDFFGNQSKREIPVRD